MDLYALGFKSLWAGLFASGFAITLTAPPRYIAPAFLCGAGDFFARGLLVSAGMNQDWATVVAAAALVLIAVASTRQDHEVSPVLLITGVLPLGAALAMFNTILALMKITSLKGEALAAESAALNANTSKVFVTTLAIALGLAGGIAIVRYFKRAEVREGPET